MNTDKLTYRIDEVMRVTGLGRSTVYQLIKEGRLSTVKVGRCTLIQREGLHVLLGRAA